MASGDKSMKKRYDFIFGIGAACSCTEALRRANLQYASLPLDWLFGSNFLGRVDILLSKFDRFIDINDLSKCSYNNGDHTNLCDVYANNYSGLIFNHDFPADVPLEVSYPAVIEKYSRRIKRLLNNIQQAQSILIVYIETPNTETHASDEDIVNGWERIRSEYPDKKIDILYFINDLNCIPQNPQKQFFASGSVIKITANYKSKCADALPYVVDQSELLHILKDYGLKTSVFFRVKQLIKKIIVNLVPIRTVRRRMRKKYHVL